MKILYSVLVTALILPVAHSQSYRWSVGQERQLRTGEYTKILAFEDGWTTYQVENERGRACHTVKLPVADASPAIDRITLPGANDTFLRIDSYRVDPEAVTWTIQGPYKGAARFRLTGERYMRPIQGFVMDTSMDGQSIEFEYQSFEYPNIKVGFFSSSGAFDMTGLVAAQARHLELCGPPDPF